MRRPIPRRFESLERRLAPAGMISFTDVDGDLVNVRSSAGTTDMLAAAVTLVPTSVPGRFQLTRVVLNHPGFAGTSLKISPPSSTAGGDGRVDVGEIVSMYDIGAVTVGGDLGSIRVGDADAATPGLTSLTVSSIGCFGTTTGSSTTISSVVGSLPAMSVGGDLRGSRFLVGGRVGTVEIGGTITGVAARDGFEADSIGRMVVGGDVRGGSEIDSGRILSRGRIDELTIGGNLEGGGGPATGVVRCGGVGIVRIGGSIVGGEGTASGGIRSDGDIESITVGGSVIGGRVDSSGHVSGQRIGSIYVGRDLVGGAGRMSGSVNAVGRIGTLGVQSIFAGAGPQSGSVTARLLGDITVRLDIRGTAQQPVWITGVGSLTTTGARAIDSLTVGGMMSRAMVLGGWLGTMPQNGNARIGAVTVQGMMRSSNVVAGVQPTVFPLFGRHLDIPIGGQRGSRIDSLVVNGEARGSGSAAEAFGVIANSIGTVRLGDRSYTATQAGTLPAGDNLMLRLTYAASDVPPPRPGFYL